MIKTLRFPKIPEKNTSKSGVNNVELKKLVGKFISFKVLWDVSFDIDLRRRYIAEVIEISSIPSIYIHLIKGGSVFHHYIDPKEIRPGSLKVLSEEETLLWKIEHE